MPRIGFAVGTPGIREKIISGDGDVARVSRFDISIRAPSYERHLDDVLHASAESSSRCPEIPRVLSPERAEPRLHRIPCGHPGEAHSVSLAEPFPCAAVFVRAVGRGPESGAEDATGETLRSDRALYEPLPALSAGYGLINGIRRQVAIGLRWFS